MWQRIRIISKKLTTWEYTPRYSRLAGDLASYKPLLEKRINDGNASHHQWAVQAKGLIQESESFLEELKIDEAWKSFHTAKRLEIFALNDQERLALAKSTFREAEKLNEWRKEAIISLLGTRKEGVTYAPAAEALIQAVELKDDEYNNQYYRNRLARNLFWLLSGLLFIVLAGIVVFFLVNIHLFGNDWTTKLNLTGYILGVLLFGTLGALTSAILFTRQLSKSSRITELGSSQVITMSKIFVGAGFSVFIFLLLRSSVADNIKLFSFSISQPIDYFAIAFLSGFTELLARKSIELLLGKGKLEDKGKQPAPEP
jgi:hypothetical protein